jgi:uncharacterized protein
MKKYYLLLIISTLILMPNCKRNTKYELKYIYDFEQVLTNKQKVTLDKLFDELKTETGNEVVLVTTADYGKEENIYLYSLDFKAKRGIGNNNKDNGVLIVFSKNKGEVSITPGKELQKMDTSGETNNIINNIMIPKFEKKEYYEGILEGSQQVVKFLKENQ